MIKQSTLLSEEVISEAKEALSNLKLIAVKPYLNNNFKTDHGS